MHAVSVSRRDREAQTERHSKQTGSDIQFGNPQRHAERRKINPGVWTLESLLCEAVVTFVGIALNRILREDDILLKRWQHRIGSSLPSEITVRRRWRKYLECDHHVIAFGPLHRKVGPHKDVRHRYACIGEANAESLQHFPLFMPAWPERLQ